MCYCTMASHIAVMDCFSCTWLRGNRDDWSGDGGGRSSNAFFQPAFLRNPWEPLERHHGIAVLPSIPTLPETSEGAASASRPIIPTVSSLASSSLHADLVGLEEEVESGTEGVHEVGGSADSIVQAAEGVPVLQTDATATQRADDEANDADIEDTAATRKRWAAMLSKRVVDVPPTDSGTSAASST